MAMRKLTSDAERISRGIDRTTTPDGCWPWARSLNIGGYGRTSVGSRVEGTFHMTSAHRVMLEQALGRPLLPGMWALHTCDVRACVRNEPVGTYNINGVPRVCFGHLWEGTTQDNTADREAKRRGAKGDRNRGFAHPERQRGIHRYNAAFTDDAIRSIRQRVAAGERLTDLASEYGVWKTAIHKIVHRESWKHVD